ncbi:hypothetical protein R70006_06308 [Paraburkholderia domus]|uniref:hypothetical protein n=1 Tax=Paraburkholderia domus TaxID=2793075 RepID=UPI001911C219|nr:hypothetical protein [Paraburkholderia domus]MBK5052935.1 hypothetical protein [Burkholderia sp. R-70006]CAE6823248.1 hypothetical protein R70006_06308 [Paraburkholderia domus]
MPDDLQILIGGLDITSGSGVNDSERFAFPSDRPASLLLDGPVAGALVRAVNRRIGLMSLPSIGATDVCMEHAELQGAIATVREDGALAETSLQMLERVLAQWRGVPHSGVIMWWNKTPYAFDVPRVVGDAIGTPG